MFYPPEWSLSDKQKEEINKAIYEQVQENLDDLTVFEDYWHSVTCSDGTVLDINIYDGSIYGGRERLQCAVYLVDEYNTIDYDHCYVFESDHLDGIDPNTNAQVEVYF